MTRQGRWLSYQADDVARLRRIPPARRSRGFFLYAPGGLRYQDWWLADAALVLGHDVPGARQAIKNEVARGVSSAYPVAGAAGLPHVVDRFLLLHGPGPESKDVPVVIVMGNPAGAAACLEEILDVSELVMEDPARVMQGNVTSDAGSANNRSAVAPVAAVAAVVRPYVAAAPSQVSSVAAPSTSSAEASAPTAVSAHNYSAPDRGPFSALVVPVGDLGLGSCCFFADDPLGAGPARLAAARCQLALLAQTGQRPIALDPAVVAADLWERRGVYLSARCSRRAYDEVFDSYLAAGIVLSPRYPGPSVIPGELSDGEAKKVVAVTEHVAASIVEGYAGDAYE